METSCFIPFSEHLPTSEERRSRRSDKNLYPERSLLFIPARWSVLSYTAINEKHRHSGRVRHYSDVDLAVGEWFFFFPSPPLLQFFPWWDFRSSAEEWLVWIINFLTSLQLRNCLSSIGRFVSQRSLLWNFYRTSLGPGPTGKNILFLRYDFEWSVFCFLSCQT